MVVFLQLQNRGRKRKKRTLRSPVQKRTCATNQTKPNQTTSLRTLIVKTPGDPRGPFSGTNLHQCWGSIILVNAQTYRLPVLYSIVRNTHKCPLRIVGYTVGYAFRVPSYHHNSSVTKMSLTTHFVIQKARRNHWFRGQRRMTE